MKTKPKKAPATLSFTQSRDDNRAAFIRRLVEAGWTRKDAAAEYDRTTA